MRQLSINKERAWDRTKSVEQFALRFFSVLISKYFLGDQSVPERRKADSEGISVSLETLDGAKRRKRLKPLPRKACLSERRGTGGDSYVPAFFYALYSMLFILMLNRFVC